MRRHADQEPNCGNARRDRRLAARFPRASGAPLRHAGARRRLSRRNCANSAATRVEGIGRDGRGRVHPGRSESNGRVIGIRADMDALPIIEATGLPYASKTPGNMHACGHDGHTAMLLGAAKYLAETRNFDGAAAVIFQPAEEGGAGGKAMVDDGLDRPFPHPRGLRHAQRARPASGLFRHPAWPVLCGDRYIHHQCHRTWRPRGATSRDDRPDAHRQPSRIGAAIDRLAQRRSDAFAGRLRHQLPHRDRRLQRHPRDGRAARHRAHFRSGAAGAGGDAGQGDRGSYRGGLGGRVEIVWQPGYPAMVNHEAETGFAVEAARRVSASVDPQATAVMGGEDFAYMLEACPGAYIQVGAGEGAGLHHPAYDFNDEAIPAGASYWAELVESRMPVGQPRCPVKPSHCARGAVRRNGAPHVQSLQPDQGPAGDPRSVRASSTTAPATCRCFRRSFPISSRRSCGAGRMASASWSWHAGACPGRRNSAASR